jgi:hypothetical protein
MSKAEDIKAVIEKMLTNEKLTDKAKRDKLEARLKEFEAIPYDNIIDKDIIKDKHILIRFVKEKLEEIKENDENN